MTKDEAIEILEGIAKDPDAYPTSRVTAIRPPLEMTKSRSRSRSIFADLDTVPVRRSGHTGRPKH